MLKLENWVLVRIGEDEINSLNDEALEKYLIQKFFLYGITPESIVFKDYKEENENGKDEIDDDDPFVDKEEEFFKKTTSKK